MLASSSENDLLQGSFTYETRSIATTVSKSSTLLNEGEYINIKDIPDTKSQTNVTTLMDNFNNKKELYYNLIPNKLEKSLIIVFI
jgi:hypothetical protein